jgi:multidrug efflux pump subunit AcrA (membrane-fusion protein)
MNEFMPGTLARIASIVSLLMLSFNMSYAQEEKSKGLPIAKVVVSEVRTGMVAPEAEFIGTVYYKEVSDIASEMNGIVESVIFEEGQRVKRGDILVKLGSDLMEKTTGAIRP